MKNIIYDHTSVLRMIEWRWNLRPLTIRDATANNLAEALNFAQPNLRAPAFTVPAGSFGSLCFPNARINNGAALLDFAASFGFPLPQ